MDDLTRQQRLAALHHVHILDINEHYGCSANMALLSGMEALGRRGIPVGCRGGAHDVAFIRQPVKNKLHHASFNPDNWGEVLKAADCGLHVTVWARARDLEGLCQRYEGLAPAASDG